MPIEQSKRPVAAARLVALARSLLDASPLCAIATVSPGGRAHVNTAYFAWSPRFDVVWLSEPNATHSRNIDANDSVAIAVFESEQTWGEPDRGIQLFGSARMTKGATADEAARVYKARFAGYEPDAVSAYCLYRFRPRRVKLFDERELGTGVFVTARVVGGGGLVWRRTDVYRGKAG
jgi:uncharacterized protein YhbP (UPF0306 family)